jgi:hypothetical protein
MFNIQAQKVNPSNLEAQFNQLNCIYRNETEFVQIIRISDPSVSFLERSVFPNQCVQFSAPKNAALEIYEVVMCNSIYADTIPCSQIAVDVVTLVHDGLKGNQSQHQKLAIAA